MRALAPALICALGFGLAACDIAETHRVQLSPGPLDDAGSSCNSALGSYALPKAFIHVRVVKKGENAPELESLDTNTSPVKVELHPDSSLVYCLDHLSSPTATDKIRVLKYAPAASEVGTGGKNYLGWVLVNTTDQTAVIAQALLRAAFILASRVPTFGGSPAVRGADEKKTLLDIEYDPFDVSMSARMNIALRQHGFCLVLENYTASSGLPHESYCSNPGVFVSRPMPLGRVYKDFERRPADPHLRGIVYRPRQNYRLSIYNKRDPDGRGPWRLQNMVSLDLENLSPVIRLDLTRAIFAGKEVDFKFDRGALVAACVTKASEVEGFVAIPLEVSKSLVALPSAVLQVQIDQVDRDRQLVEAERRVLDAQNAVVQALMIGSYASPSGLTKRDPPASYLGADTDLVDLNDEKQVEKWGFSLPPRPRGFGAKPDECEPKATSG